MKWIRIDGVASFQKEQGLCFAGFSLPHPANGAAPCKKEKQVLRRVFLLGAPFLYIRHESPLQRKWNDVARTLEELVAGLGNLEAFVDEFRDRFVCGEEDAEQASLVWDDPAFNPFKNGDMQQDSPT